MLCAVENLLNSHKASISFLISISFPLLLPLSFQLFSFVFFCSNAILATVSFQLRTGVKEPPEVQNK